MYDIKKIQQLNKKNKRNIARNKAKMQMSGFEPTDASFEGQLINH